MEALTSEHETKKFCFVHTKGRFDAIDLKVVIIKTLKDGIQLLEVQIKGTIGDQGDVVNETDDVLHVGEMQSRADGEAHGEALVGVLTPKKDEGGKALAVFVELDRPKAHVEIQDGNEGKSINIAHNFLDGQKWKWASAEMVVEHAEVCNKLDLIVFLWNSKSLCSPFRIIGVVEDADVTEAFDFGLA